MADADITHAQAPDATVEPDRPHRIQRKRTAGWRMPPNTVYVGRPSKWGNPFNLRDFRRVVPDGEGDAFIVPDAVRRQFAVDSFREAVEFRLIDIDYPSHDEIRRDLAGKNLACWCPLSCRCHADVLLRIANGGAE